MKKVIVIISIAFASCNDSGVTRIPLSGNEESVPDEIRGIKIFKVALSDGDFIKVAVTKDGSIAAVKSQKKNTAIINKKEYKILSENDSILVLKKN